MGSDAPKVTAIYHDMRVHENFAQCANRLFTMVRDACRMNPESPRVLFLEIQGHRNSAGGYDADALEIQREFLCNFLMPYLSEAHVPLCHLINPNGQSNDVPNELVITDPDHAIRTGLRDETPETRNNKPTLRAIANYLGLEEPRCMICWATPVERAHARPAALQGSNDVRNFALLCERHHKLAPDVDDSNAFWQWVDWRLSIDHPLAERSRPMTIAHETGFFRQVRQEATELYGEDLTMLGNADWIELMDIYHRVLDTETSKHFGVERKVSTHAWALHRALREMSQAGPPGGG